MSDVSTSNDSESLCLECGFCCNGVIFADVELRPRDDRDRFQALGLPLVPVRATQKANGTGPGIRHYKFTQPCAALNGCRCTIYPERPEYCREFECLVLKSVKAGRLNSAA